LQALLLLVALSPFAFSQYYPRPRYPQGGRQSGGAKDNKGEDNLLATFTGPVKGVDKKSILLVVEGENDVQFHISRKTTVWDGDQKISPQNLKPGTPVSVEAKRFPDGSLDAVNVRVEHAKKAQAQ
jgi:hypothetical protein